MLDSTVINGFLSTLDLLIVKIIMRPNTPTLTLEPFVRGELLKHREKQERMKKVKRSAYSK